jgi:pyrimidine oxygenase
MDFGIFLPTINDGWIRSPTGPKYTPSFELNRQIVRLAEGVGFTFALSMARFRGLGAQGDHWDHALESLTLTSALIASTERLKLYASIATLTLPPAVVARMAVTTDDVAPGRFGLNIVAGWNRPEYEQMGMWPGDEFFDDRYAYAEEYVTILRELWASGRSSFKGRYFALEDCQCLPLPKGGIDIVYAGNSGRGRQFTAQYADYNFTIAKDVDSLAQTNDELVRGSARCGRTVSSYPLFVVIIDSTDDAAEARLACYDAGVPSVAPGTAGGQRARSVGSSAPLLVGSPSTVAAQLQEFAAVPGTGGIMLIFDDYLDGVARFGAEVLPILGERGAR